MDYWAKYLNERQDSRDGTKKMATKNKYFNLRHALTNLKGLNLYLS